MMNQKTVNALSAMALLASPFRHATVAGQRSRIQDNIPQESRRAWAEPCPRASRVYN